MNISGNDVGFGVGATVNHQRMLHSDGSSNVKRVGLPFFRTSDNYNSLITMSWGKFLLIVVTGYLIINILFATTYVIIGVEHLNGISGTTPTGKFLDAFFFSAQTISTVGYGHISPKGTLTSFVAAFESMLGLLAFALATGLLYGRFSRPSAKILYSSNMLIAPYQDGKALMFRLTNYRKNQLIEIEAQLLLTLNVMENGKSMRKYFSLELERKKINLLMLNWTVVHPISAESPFSNLTEEDLKRGEAEILVLIKAFDDTFSQTVHSRTSYQHDQIIWDAKFQPMYAPDEEGITTLDLSKINDYQKLK